MNRIFISHTHNDQPIADALSRLIERLFSNNVEVSYSTKKELNGGISPGEDWFHWIVEQVRASKAAFVLLTPSSIQKPWVLWEAGAVAGVEFATKPETDISGPPVNRVYPITFGLSSVDVPSPFARTQLVAGESEADMKKLVTKLLECFGDHLTHKQSIDIAFRSQSAVKDYVGGLAPIMRKLPHIITEAAIQEWLERLRELEKSARFSETSVLENWLDVAFGREENDLQRPIDVRIHRRMGELYAAGGTARDAARQFELARKLVPRDIFLLRQLGKAYLDIGDAEKAREILNNITDLDSKAFVRNVESAALKARWHEQCGDLQGAQDTLEAAYQNTTFSYYLSDRLGQILVKRNNLPRAREIYAQVRRHLQDLREHNVWTCATALTAAMVCDDRQSVAGILERLCALQPSRDQLNSISRGAYALARALDWDTSLFQEILIDPGAGR